MRRVQHGQIPHLWPRMAVVSRSFVTVVVGSLSMCVLFGGVPAPEPHGFDVKGIVVRRVEPRYTPTVTNAALNFRNFLDGRANNIFNGVDPFGRRTKAARILEVQSDGDVEKIKVEFENSSLASQAVRPPLSPLEM